MKQISTHRSRRHRNPHTQESEKQTPFFSKESTKADSNNAFFQPKLTIGQPGDKYEQEADSMADAVVNGSNDLPAVQKKAKGIQKMDSSRMEEDRAVQEKSMIQRMEAGEKEEPVQMQSMKEEESIQMMSEEEEPIQKMEGEEEESVQMQEEEPVQMMEGEEEEAAQMKEEEEDAVQTKSNTAKNTASPKLSQQIKNRSGNGKTMSDPVRTEMEQAFGTDFSGVNIHTDSDAVQMNKELGAQAFTHGKDVYFNSGKYNPENSQGKHLLAHELTHVVQQKGMVQKKVVKKDLKSSSVSKKSSKNKSKEKRNYFPEMRRAEIQVDPQPVVHLSLNMPNKQEQVVDNTFIIRDRIRKGDQDMITANMAAAGKTAKIGLAENLTNPLSWLSSGQSFGFSDDDGDRVHAEQTMRIYLKLTKKTIKSVKEEYKKERKKNQTVKAMPEQTLYFDFDSVEFNKDLTPRSFYRYAVNEIRKYVKEAHIYKDQLARFRAKKPEITILAYSSFIGSESYNEKLSMKRAEHIKNKLSEDLKLDHNLYIIKSRGMGVDDTLIVY
ncbi:MAG: DUF4157 domain-containing protein [Bacteroidota bacterium]